MRRFAILLALVPLLFAAPAASYTPTSSERYAHANVNGARTYLGKRPLALNSSLSYCAHQHSVRMATRWRLYHSQCSSYRENVGYSTSLDRVLRMFLASSGHRANVLCSCSRIAVGVAYSNGYYWVTEIYY